MTRNISTNPTALEQWQARVREDPDFRALEVEAAADLEVAELIYQARTAAGVTQKELGERVGTSPSAISRLEDADYEGHSLAMLRRVAAALGKRVVVRFVDLEAEQAAGEASEELIAA